jgi:hypothetical protein
MARFNNRKMSLAKEVFWLLSSTFMKCCICFFAVSALLLAATVGMAGEDLSKYGKQWESIQQQWNSEQQRHERRLSDLEANAPPAKRQQLIREENARHRATSKKLAQRREAIHQRVEAEVNRRMGGEDLKYGEGSRANEERHRGMTGDSDMGGSDKAARTAKEVLDDMGIKVKTTETPGSVEFGDGFELTINKQDPLGKTGTGARQAELDVKAANKETYVSVAMDDKQPGKKHVATLDHAKKARHGIHHDDPQLMAKGTSKAIDSAHVTDADLQEIIRKNDLNETPESFRDKLDRMKGETRPEDLGLSDGDMEKMKNACSDTLDKATERSKRVAKAEIDSAEHKLRALENSSDPKKRAEGKKLREQLADSRERVRATEQVNEDLKKAPPPENNPKTQKTDQKTPESTQKSEKTGKKPPETPEKQQKPAETNEKAPETPEKQQKSAETPEKSPETPEKRAETTEPADAKKQQKTAETDAPDAQKVKKTPETDVPDVQKPKTPEVDVPDTKKPRKTPEVDVPDTKKPRKTPEIDVPDTQKPRKTPETDVPDTQKPKTGDADGVKTGTGGKIMNVADGVGDVIDAIDKGSTYVEGAVEGDTSKMVSTIVGQDTAERTRAKGAEKLTEELDDLQEKRGDEVRQELKAKLRRKGASDTEAEEAMRKRDAGDHDGYKEDVAKIKEKGIEDPSPRGFTPDGPLDEEDGMGERLTEGAKQAGSYVDSLYGGLIQRTENSVEQRDNLNSEHDATIDTMKDEVDSELARKLVRKGASRTDAEEAIARKNQGDPSMYNKLRDEVRGNEDTDQRGLDADGRTTSYEAGDYADDVVDNIKTGAEGAGTTILRPVSIYHEYQERKDLEQKSQATSEQGEEVKNRLINAGVDPTEAEKAGKDFARGNFSTAKNLMEQQKQDFAEKLVEKHGVDPDEARQAADDWMRGEKSTAYDLRKRQAEKRRTQTDKQPPAEAPPEQQQDDWDDDWDEINREADAMTDDLFGSDDDDDDWWGEDDDFSGGEDAPAAPRSRSHNPLRTQEGYSGPGDNDDFDWGDGEGGSLLGDMIGRMETETGARTEKSLDFNQWQHDIDSASSSGDGMVAAAQQRVNSANTEASVSQEEAITKVTATDREESWGSAIGDGLTDGITSGAAQLGAAIAAGINASVYGRDQDKDSNDDSSGEEGEGEAQTASADGSRASGGGGGAPAPQGAAPSGGAQPPAEAGGQPDPEPAGQTAATGAQPASGGVASPAPATSGRASAGGAIYCPKCGGTSFGPYEEVYQDGRQIARDRRCLTCGNLGGRIGTPPTKPAVKPTPKPPATAGQTTCPRCGAAIARPSSNTPLCTRCCSVVALDRGMQRAAESKGQKRTPREQQWYGVCP